MVCDMEGHCKLGEAQRTDVLTWEQITEQLKTSIQ